MSGHDAAKGSRFLIIVAPSLMARYEHLKRCFDGHGWVTVILDRRSGQRRQDATAESPERRRGDRRSWQYCDDALLLRGWGQVWIE